MKMHIGVDESLGLVRSSRYIKTMFGYGKVRYRGQAKNANSLHLPAGSRTC
ncbi:MAG: hypothetical protein ACOY9J_09550 [Pseudomonadota bacterium]